MRRNTDWDDDRVDPLKGPNRPTEFLKANFKILSTGGTFRTVKAKFSRRTISDHAKRAGVRIKIENQDPWLKVTIVGRLKPRPPKIKRQDVYLGAGKVYPTPDIFS